MSLSQRPALNKELREYDDLFSARLRHVVPVREPLVLISQVPRSGGTLLSQLFDGHPQCHAHPHELRIGHPSSRDWPPLDLAAPETWFDVLYEKHARKHFRDGYRKPAGVLPTPGAEFDVFPFLFLARLQRRIFEQCVAQGRVARERDVLDCYFTSYFNAWLDNHNLYTGPKKVVTAFAPELNARADIVAKFFSAYPDGTLVSIVRDPAAWYASARTQKKHAANVDDALASWARSVDASLAARDEYAERVVLLTYEQLVQQTEETMARLARQIGIEVSPELLMPTFNGQPIRPNSSDAVQSYGVVADRATAYRETLDDATLARVAELAGDRYERALTATR